MGLRHLLITAFLIHLSVYSFATNGFEKNNGQIVYPSGERNEEVLYFFQNDGFKVSLRKNGFSYEVTSITTPEKLNEINNSQINIKVGFNHERVDFVFPKLPEDIIENSPLRLHSTYYTPNGIISTSSYRKIIYKGINEGVDIEFIISNNHFKYNIIKNKGAVLEDFYLKVKSDIPAKIIDNQLHFGLSDATLKENIPFSYIEGSGESKNIHYKLDGDRLLFDGESISNHEKLIIDPEPDMIWSTFYGGNQYDFITDTSIDGNDTLYAVGITMSANNISTSGAHQTTYQGDLDIFISKLDTDGNLYWSTYYSGPQSERSYAIHIDENHDLYVAGSTFSPIGFITPGAHQTSVEGTDDIFILKMNTSGNRIWGTYHGGNGHDFVTDMNVIRDTIYLVGHTTSSNNIASIDAHQDTYTANEAGHITLFDANGQFLWGTYFGDSQNNSIEGVAVTRENILIAGRTTSSTGISTTGSFQENFGGFTDGFLSAFSKSGNQLWGTYYGGLYTDVATDIVLDTLNGVFIVGNTSSENDIATTGAYQETRLSSDQGFIAHFDKDGSRIWGTYTGGTGTDYVSIVETDVRGSILVGGNTTSTDEISSPDAYQTSHNAAYDCFIQRFNFDGTYEWGTYLGGSGNEDITSLAQDKFNNIISSGSTNQNDTIFAIGNSLNNQYGGGTLDGFLAYLCQANQVSILYIGDSLTIDSEVDEVEWFLNGESLNLFSNSIDPQADGNYTVITSTNGKCEATSDQYYYSSVSVHNNTMNQIQIFPNPTTSNIYIKNTLNSRIYISDLAGRVIFEKDNVSQTSIDLSSFSKGSYVITIIDKLNMYQKIIIKK